MNLQATANDVAEATTTTETKKRIKLSKYKQNFIQHMQFLFPEEVLDFTVDDTNEFTDPTVAKYFKIFHKGRDTGRFYEPELFIVGKVTDAGELQFSDAPKVMKNFHMAQVAIDRMTKRFGGPYLAFGLSKGWAQMLAKKLLLEDTQQLEQLKVRVRPNPKPR